MSQEDKPVAEPRLVSYGLNMETCTLNLSGDEYYYDLKATTIDGSKPVAAQEPWKPTELQIIEAAEKAGLWPNTVHTWMPAFHRFFEALPTLYANAAPCARCAELEDDRATWKARAEFSFRERDKLQARIAEQAVETERLTAIGNNHQATSTLRADRIKALEAEVERQRKVIEDVKQFINTPISVESCDRMNASIAELEKGVG